MTFTINPEDPTPYTIPEFINVTNDDIAEVEQFFALVAEIGEDVLEETSCFQIAEGQTECFGREGAVQIRIINDDGEFNPQCALLPCFLLPLTLAMIIGFDQRSQTVSESLVPEGEDFVGVSISVSSKRMSEQQYRTDFSLELDSTAVVDVSDPVTPDWDAVLRTPSANLRIGETSIGVRVNVRNDFRAEDTECFTIRIQALDEEGLRDIFECNDDTSGEDSFFCLHTLCIEDDDG